MTTARTNMTREYSLAHVDGGTGEFLPFETFEATDDDAANAYAEAYGAERDDDDWYVLDAAGHNINA